MKKLILDIYSGIIVSPLVRKRKKHKSHVSTWEGRLFWNSTKKILALLIGAFVLFFGLAQNSWAEEHVVTIYFGGTGLPENAYDGEHTRWDSPNLIATLHDSQVAAPDINRQYKIFVAGVGAPETSTEVPPDHCDNPGELRGDSFKQQKDPHKNICRNWTHTVFEGTAKLEGLLINLNVQNVIKEDDTLTLNVVGHSRGAIAAMWFLGEGMDAGGYLDNLILSGLLTKTNLIALDPVPGIGMLSDKYDDVTNIGWGDFRLNTKLMKFVAIYADDERSNRFAAMVPYIPETTDTLMFRVRGGHQTMVGNLWKSGHAPFNFGDGCDINCEQKHPTLQVVHDLVAITIVELLSGSEWGGVAFPTEFTDTLLTDLFDDSNTYNNRHDAFIADVEDMNTVSSLQTIYEWIRESSYFPALPDPLHWLRPFMPLEEFHENDGCLRISIDHIGKDRWPRCMTRVTNAWNLYPNHVTNGLNFENGISDIPLIGGADIYDPSDFSMFSERCDNSDLCDQFDPSDLLSGEEAWDLIAKMGFSDDDDDGVVSDIDMCPNTGVGDPVDIYGCSDSQVDGDSDGFCDAGALSGGPSECIDVDNCPAVSNNNQNNFDADNAGDACDDDIDNDGVINEIDSCEFTPLNEVVNSETGCAIIQLAPCEGPIGQSVPWNNHGQYMRSVSHVVKDFINLGLITRQEAALIMFSAAYSSCGK